MTEKEIAEKVWELLDRQLLSVILRGRDNE